MLPEAARVLARGFGLPPGPLCTRLEACGCHSGTELLPRLALSVGPSPDELTLERAEADLSDDWPAAAVMDAIERAEQVDCSHLALALAGDAVRSAAMGESAERWRGDVLARHPEEVDWFIRLLEAEDELRRPAPGRGPRTAEPVESLDELRESLEGGCQAWVRAGRTSSTEVARLRGIAEALGRRTGESPSVVFNRAIERAREPVRTRRCPRCGTELELVDADGEPVWICPACAAGY